MSLPSLPAQVWLTSLALALAAPLLLSPQSRRAGWVLAAAGYGLAALDGRLAAPAFAALALAGLVALGLRAAEGRDGAGGVVGGVAAVDGTGGAGGPAARGRAWLAHLALGLLALPLLLHAWPGFGNARVAGPLRLTPEAQPYSLYFNLDASVVALALFAGWAPLRADTVRRGWLLAGLGWGGATALVCLGAGVAAGALAPMPKWPDLAPAWLLAQIGGTVFVEETVFRGWLQAGLARRFGPGRGLLLAAPLFGLAHAAGGPLLVLLATLAGVGYGMAWRRGGLAAAMLAHLVLNLLHFGLLTYPARG